jgi:hypothetical protein
MPDEHRYPTEYERALRASLLGATLGVVLAVLARPKGASSG